jgi:hypothetical protein
VAEPIPKSVKREQWRGDTRVWTHTFTDPATGDPYDLTGHDFIAQWREDRNRGNLLATATCVVLDGPGGIMQETLSATEADGLPGQVDPDTPTIVYWDLQSTDGDGAVQTWEFSKVKVWGDSSDA